MNSSLTAEPSHACSPRQPSCVRACSKIEGSGLPTPNSTEMTTTYGDFVEMLVSLPREDGLAQPSRNRTRERQ
jgi:hypothetical protein